VTALSVELPDDTIVAPEALAGFRAIADLAELRALPDLLAGAVGEQAEESPFSLPSGPATGIPNGRNHKRVI